MVDDDTIYEKSSLDPVEPRLLDPKILTPKSSLAALQLRSQVRNQFNAGINGLESGNDVRTNFSSNSKTDGDGILEPIIDQTHDNEPRIMNIDDNVMNNTTNI